MSIRFRKSNKLLVWSNIVQTGGVIVWSFIKHLSGINKAVCWALQETSRKPRKIQETMHAEIMSCEIMRKVFVEIPCEVSCEVGLKMPSKHRKIMQKTENFCSPKETKNDVSARFSRKHAVFEKWRQGDSNHLPFFRIIVFTRLLWCVQRIVCSSVCTANISNLPSDFINHATKQKQNR